MPPDRLKNSSSPLFAAGGGSEGCDAELSAPEKCCAALLPCRHQYNFNFRSKSQGCAGTTTLGKICQRLPISGWTTPHHPRRKVQLFRHDRPCCQDVTEAQDDGVMNRSGTCGGGGARDIKAGLSSERCSPGRLDRKPPVLPTGFSPVGRFMFILHVRHQWHSL